MPNFNFSNADGRGDGSWTFDVSFSKSCVCVYFLASDDDDDENRSIKMRQRESAKCWRDRWAVIRESSLEMNSSPTTEPDDDGFQSVSEAVCDLFSRPTTTTGIPQRPNIQICWRLTNKKALATTTRSCCCCCRRHYIHQTKMLTLTRHDTDDEKHPLAASTICRLLFFSTHSASLAAYLSLSLSLLPLFQFSTGTPSSMHSLTACRIRMKVAQKAEMEDDPYFFPSRWTFFPFFFFVVNFLFFQPVAIKIKTRVENLLMDPAAFPRHTDWK